MPEFPKLARVGALTILALSWINSELSAQWAVDPLRGEIDGRVAVAFWPQKADDPDSRLDPSTYGVHLVPATDLDQELVYPAGKWFRPPPGRYRVWLEGQSSMSRSTLVLHYAGAPFEGRGLLSGDPVFPAGRIVLSSEVATTPGTALRLLHVDSHNRGKHPQREVSRRLYGDRLRESVLMPEGSVLAALFDNHAQQYLAIARPLRVVAGKVSRVRPEPPVASTDLLVWLDRPKVVDSFEEYDVELSLTVDGAIISPAVVVPTASRVYGIWYGLKERYAELRIDSSRVFLEPQEIVLRPGKVEVFYGELQALPSLDVDIELPEELREKQLALEVVVPSEGRTVERLEMAAQSARHRFERVPRKVLEVALEVPPWIWYQRIDLSDGRDGLAVFRPEPIHLTGAVYRGEKGHPATIDFRLGTDRFLEVPTERNGEYETVLFQPIYFVKILLRDVGGPPWVELLREPITTSRALDFHLPDNAYRARVVDALTGAGIAGAQVTAENVGIDGEVAIQSSVADQEGIARLQPLRPGTVSLSASADGYRATPVSQVAEVANDGSSETFTLSLEPAGSLTGLRLVLPNGSAARRAEVSAHRWSMDSGSPLWSGRSDDRGLANVPVFVDGAMLLVRHPGAGFMVRRWQTPGDGEVVLWTLPPAAPPLRIRTIDAAGDPAPWSDIALWIDGLRLQGAILGWLTSSHASSDSDGLWEALGLPDRAVEVVAWRIEARESGRTGAFDTLATPVPFPWGQAVRIRAFD